MSATIRVQPLRLDLKLTFDKLMGPEARSKLLADFARERRDEALVTNAKATGSPPEYDTIVDGVSGAPLTRVMPDGTIAFSFHLMGEALTWIDQQLIEASPKLTGRYSKSHVLFADGTECDPADPPQASQYVFLNVQPYARKIEKGLSRQAPEGVYEAVAALAQQRFGLLAKFRFTYRAPTDGAVVDWAHSTSRTLRRKRHTRAAIRRDMNQPAIVITVK